MAYWQIGLASDSSLTSAKSSTRFRDLLTEFVRLRLRGDVPVGSCLSGGLDFERDLYRA